jgi:hypothetical protein
LDIIVANKGTEAKRMMVELLASCEGNPLTAALGGYIFEPHAIELLEKGGDFTCRQLVDGNKKLKPSNVILTIPSSSRITVPEVKPNQTEFQLYVPKTKNHVAFDAWIPGIGAFQIIVGNRMVLK